MVGASGSCEEMGKCVGGYAEMLVGSSPLMKPNQLLFASRVYLFSILGMYMYKCVEEQRQRSFVLANSTPGIFYVIIIIILCVRIGTNFKPLQNGRVDIYYYPR